MELVFSQKSILELTKALKFPTHNDVDQFSLEFDLGCVVSGRYIAEKKTSIATYLVSNPGARGPNGSALVIEIVEYLARQHDGFGALPSLFPELAHSLDRDGFELSTAGLRRKLPAIVPVVEQENQLLALLGKFSLATAREHYEQAIAAHARGEWASANAQLRSFVEEFFDRVQTIVCPGEYASSHERRTALARAGFFVHEYNEFLCNGTGFVEGFWKRLHPQGSHPGLSEESDSTFRLHLVILVVHYFLTRLEARYGNRQTD